MVEDDLNDSQPPGESLPQEPPALLPDEEETIESSPPEPGPPEEPPEPETSETWELPAPEPARRSSTLPLPVLEQLEHEPPVKRPEEARPGKDEKEEPEEPAARRLSEQWRIDLKWIFGIPATILLILLLAAIAFFRVSGEQQSGEVMSATRDQVMADARFRLELRQVDPQLMTVIESDGFIQSLYEDPEMFRSVVDATPDGEEGDPRAGQYEYVRSVLGIFSDMGVAIGKDNHLQARSALIIISLLLALFVVPYMICSRRLGKIASAAASLALASWIPYLTLRFARGSLSDWIADRASATEDYQAAFVLDMADTYARALVDRALPMYRYFSLVALILLGFGLIGVLVVWWRYEESLIPRKRKLRDGG